MESAGKMPKYNPQRLDVEEEEKPEKKVVKAPSTQKIVLLIDAYFKVVGKYSGREYLFDRAGSVIDVDSRDVNWMLEKRQGGRQCCGGSADGNVVFRLAEE